MVYNEQVMDFTATILRNDVVDYRRVLRLTTVSGQRLFLAFPDVPPADWLEFPDGTDTNVFLPSADFDATYRVLRDESPVFVTELMTRARVSGAGNGTGAKAAASGTEPATG